MVFDFLYNNLEITITLFQHSNDKDLKEIQQILISIEVTNFAKCITS